MILRWLIVLGSVLWAGCQAELPHYLREADKPYLTFFNETVSELLSGYRLPSERDFKDYWTYFDSFVYKTEDDEGNHKAPFWTKGDFNDDGQLDYCYILIEEESGIQSFFGFISSESGYRVLLLDDGLESEMGLATQMPGELLTASGKGYSPATSDDPPLVRVEHQAIAFFHFESASSVFIWDQEKQEFRRHWLSD